ncbi:MAG: hypothetical protein RL071_1388, partial [Pseudomonadota bacterium]
MQGQAGRPAGPAAPSTAPEAEALLARALAAAEARNDAVAVIRVVERWLELGAPPAAARLAEARALLSLRLADRAWVRLREVTEQDADQVDALLLLAEMFVARGWPPRAQRVLERLDQLGHAGPAVEQLRRAAAAPAQQPPADAREIERTGDTAALLGLAESFLLAGSVIRAQALLERLARTAPAHPRVRALLWGVRGEFVDRHAPLEALLQETAPEVVTAAPSRMPFGGFLPATEAEANDHETAEASRHGGGLEVDAAAFPQLFRGAGGGGHELEKDDEVTMAAVLSPASEVGALAPREDTDPDALQARQSGDTQIMQVIQSGGARKLTAVEGPVHARSGAAPGANLHKTLDLRAWQQEMGVAPGEPEEDWLDEEDQDLVVMNRKEDRAPSPPPPAVERRTPVEVVTRPVPAPVAAPSSPRVALDEGPDGELTPPERPSPVPRTGPGRPVGPHGPHGPVADPPSRPRIPWPALVLIGALVGVVLVVGLLLSLRASLGSWGAEDALHDVGRGDPAHLEALSKQLAAAARARPAGAEAAELAVVESFRFAFIDADPALGAAAAQAIAAAPAGDPRQALAGALLRWGQGDPAGAAAALPAELQHPWADGVR